jgi:PPP family 3-phenylpropionic acid transporter
VVPSWPEWHAPHDATFPVFLAVYALLYAAFGVQSPFLPALLRERGLSAEEIGSAAAARQPRRNRSMERCA